MEERELPEVLPPKLFDAITFYLQFCPLQGDYREEKALVEDVRLEARKAIEARPDYPGKAVVLAGPDRGRMKPALLFGADFWPDMVVEVDGEPVMAIAVAMVKRRPSAFTQAAGRALVYSYLYPWVLVFILDKGKRRREKRALDHEFRSDMWHNRHVRFLFR